MTQAYRLSLTLSFAAGYAVLAILLFAFHDSPTRVALAVSYTHLTLPTTSRV